MRRISVLAMIVLLFGGSRELVAATSAVVVQLATVNADWWGQEWHGPAELGAEQSVVLKSEVAGRISALNLREGLRVKAGQVLVELDDSLIQAQLLQAQLEQEYAEKEFRRGQDLLKKDALTRQAADELAMQSKLAAAKVLLLQRQQEKTRIRAPFSGTLAFTQVSVGDYISAGQALIQLVNTEALWLEARLPQDWSFKLVLGQRLSFTTEGLAVPIESQIDRIAPDIGLNDRALRLRAKINNSTLALRPGLFGQMHLVLAPSPVLTVPELALIRQPLRSLVFRVRDNKAESVEVQTGEIRQGRVEIRSGLAVNEQVIVAPPARLSSGSLVEPR